VVILTFNSRRALLARERNGNSHELGGRSNRVCRAVPDFVHNDTLVTLFPPDILLVVIANSDLAEHWLIYLLVLGLASVVAGMLGWCLGRWLRHLKFFQRLFGQFNEEQRTFIAKYGFWAIVLGAATPLPYSVSSWTAGALGVHWSTVLAASILFRIPFIIYYLVIASTGTLFG
jgi:membrane protein YqaA with SNARE-associated domain